jgi:glutaredoxin-related protein
MSRPVLEASRIHPAIRSKIDGLHADIVQEVQAAVAANKVVVVGMAMNPFPRKARTLLDAQGTPYVYLEYGSYLSQWRRRTLPMVFINGTLVGGFQDLKKLVDSGEFTALVAPKLV